MNDKILFAWDFHGTLETGNVYAVQELIDLVLKDFGFEKEITIKEVKEWYGLSWYDYFRLLVPQGDEKLWKDMVAKVLSLQQDDWSIARKHIQPRESALDVLKTIKEKGCQNILISNSLPKDIKLFTELLGVTGYFDHIFGVDSHHDTRIDKEIHLIKRDVLEDFIKDKNYNKIIVIGDRETDILAGKKCGATTYLVIEKEAEGQEIKTEADYVICNLKEVLRQL